MKKEYIIFAVVLVILAIIYSLSRNYIWSSKQESESVRDRAIGDRKLDDLRDEFNAKFTEHEALIDSRLDSLEQNYRENVEPYDTVSDSLTAALEDSLQAVRDTVVVVETLTVVDTFTVPAETVKVELRPEKAIAAVPDNSPTETEIRIYNRYLKKRWSLPGDLTKYELKVAKAEIHDNLGSEFGLAASEIAAIVDKVYKYRKAGKK